MKTLVVGATGLVGFEVCRRLSEAGQSVRGLIRRTSDAGKRAELRSPRRRTRRGRPQGCRVARAAPAPGCRRSFPLPRPRWRDRPATRLRPSTKQGQLALVDAARGAGVEHFVFVSFRDNPSIQYPLTAAKRAVERRGEDLRHGLHDPAGVVLHGDLAVAGPRLRRRQRKGRVCTATATSRSAGSPIAMWRAPPRPQ